MRPLKHYPTVPCAAKFWTCLRRLGSSPNDPPWPKPIASHLWDWNPVDGCWPKTRAQHHEHSRVLFLYHKKFL